MENLMNLYFYLKSTELILKNMKQTEYYYPDKKINYAQLREVYYDKIFNFISQNDFYTIMENINDNLTDEEINNLITFIDYAKTIPFLIPTEELKKILALNDNEKVEKFPNLCACSDEYLNNKLAKLIVIKNNKRNSVKL